MQILRKSILNFISLLGYASTLLAINVFGAAVHQTVEAKEPGAHHHSLLIFAPDKLSKPLAKQLATFSGQLDELQIREIVLIYVVGKSGSGELGSNLVV